VEYWPDETPLGSLGHPDGRACSTTNACVKDSGSAYSCERAGLFGMTTVNRRVRYVGTLQDPNEVALYCSITVPFAFALRRLKPSRSRKILAVVTLAMVAFTVVGSQSRGGYLVLFTVLSVCATQRFGLKRVLQIAVPLGLVLLVSSTLSDGGSDPRSDAAQSTEKRLGCMKAGIEMLLQSPLVGVGYGQFTRHHEQTAHNSYVLAAAELGLVGMLLWTATAYFAVKGVVVARAQCSAPEAWAGRVWGNAIVAALAGLLVGVFFLSFSYHFTFWLLVAFAAAYGNCVFTHRKQWAVGVVGGEVALITCGSMLLLAAVYGYASYRLS
jgi:O-antigen ligase